MYERVRQIRNDSDPISVFLESNDECPSRDKVEMLRMWCDYFDNLLNGPDRVVGEGKNVQETEAEREEHDQIHNVDDSGALPSEEEVYRMQCSR